MKRMLAFLLAAMMILTGFTLQATAEGITGFFTGAGTGYGGAITLEVEINDNVIENITVVKSNETEGIGTMAFDRLITEIIEKQSVNVDAISGCTMASNGTIEAVTSALLAAGLDLADYQKETAKADQSKETVIINKDIVIVGAGPAGMTAGIYAKEGGADVLVLEKTATVGGAGAISSGATNALGSQFAREKGVEDSSEGLKNDIMTAGHQYNQENLVDLFIQTTGETFDWLVGLGVHYSDPTPSEEHSVNRVFLSAGSGISITNAIYDKAVSDGVEIMLETTATELMTDNSRVIGVKAHGKDGTTYEINASSVVLATGGYGANSDLLTDALAEVPYYGAACSTGDGHIMASAVGAKLVNMDFGKVYPGGWEYEKGKAKISLGYTLLAVQQEGAIIVNPDGVRSFREGGYNYEFKAAIRASENNMLYLLLDGQAYDAWRTAVLSKARGNLGSEEDIDAAIAANGATAPVIYHGDTLSEAAQSAGIDADTLQATVDRWNGFVDNNKDEDFGRTALPRKIGDGPYYLVGEVLRFATTLGGVEINPSFEIQDVNDQVIPGLYGIGEIVYGVSGDDTIQGTPLTWAISSGRLVGQQLTDD